MGCIGAEFMPVITVVADEVDDFVEGLVRYGVLEGHVSGMGGELSSGSGGGSGGGFWRWWGRFVAHRSPGVGGVVVGGGI